MVDLNDYLHGSENFQPTPAFRGQHGFVVNSSPHGSAGLQRGFAESNARLGSSPGRFGGFGNEGFARNGSDEGRAGVGGIAHEGGDAHGEGARGGGAGPR
jgi:hypothetical protein